MSKITYDADQVKSVFAANPKESSIIITSDGNVFLTKHKSYAKNHCNEFKQEFEELTRAEFEAGKKGGNSKTPAASTAPSKDWKDGKFGEIVEFAKSKGLETKTRTNQGKPALIVEVETFLATLEADKNEASKEGEGSKSEPKEGDDDYVPVGAGGTGSED